MEDFLFITNQKNANSLQDEYGFHDYVKDNIKHQFWPIIELRDVTIDEFKDELLRLSKDYRSYNGKYRIKTFHRHYLDGLVSRLTAYSEELEQEKVQEFDKFNSTYFHWFKLNYETKFDTLLLSQKNGLELEMYFLNILDCIDAFMLEHGGDIPAQHNAQEKASAVNHTITNLSSKHVSPVSTEETTFDKGFKHPEVPNTGPEKTNETPQIIFREETVDKLYESLKPFFNGQGENLQKVLAGEKVSERLLFNAAQNRLVEVFKRLRYNKLLLSTPKETKDWLCANFSFNYKRGNEVEVKNLNPSTVHDILTKEKGEPTKSNRICEEEWLPYITKEAREQSI